MINTMIMIFKLITMQLLRFQGAQETATAIDMLTVSADLKEICVSVDQDTQEIDKHVLVSDLHLNWYESVYSDISSSQ